MTKEEFKAVVDDAVKNGADRKEAEEYVRRGYKVDFGSDDAETKTAKKKK